MKMKNSSKTIVIQQPTNKKYLVTNKTVLEMKDQNDNRTEGSIKEEPFIVEEQQTSVDQTPQRRVLYFSDGILELDENGNPIEEVKREKRSLKGMVKHRPWNVFDSIDSPVLNSATHLGSNVGRKTMSAIDYIGNMFAGILGITGKLFFKLSSKIIFTKVLFLYKTRNSIPKSQMRTSRTRKRSEETVF